MQDVPAWFFHVFEVKKKMFVANVYWDELSDSSSIFTKEVYCDRAAHLKKKRPFWFFSAHLYFINPDQLKICFFEWDARWQSLSLKQRDNVLPEITGS